jgi:uncharacterized protein (DUF433 family)
MPSDVRSELIVSDPGVLGGRPCFRRTRVPVDTLFENLADGMTVDQILAAWPTLDRDDVLAVLKLAPGALAPAAA